MDEGYRLSAKLVLDGKGVIRDADTFAALGAMVFVDGMKDRVLAGLEATYGMEEDGPLVTTPEERAEMLDVLSRVGIDPALFNMSENDSQIDSEAVDVLDGPSESWLKELFGRVDPDAVTLLAMEALAGLPDEWTPHVNEKWFLDTLASVDLVAARACALNAEAETCEERMTHFRAAILRELTAAKRRSRS